MSATFAACAARSARPTSPPAAASLMRLRRPIVYPPGGFVEWHIDQKDNEVSLSLQVDIEPAGASWPLFFVDYNYSASPGVSPPAEINLNAWHVEHAAELRFGASNEGVIYRGQELVHYRPPLPEGLRLMQVVFAWRVPNERSCNG